MSSPELSELESEQSAPSEPSDDAAALRASVRRAMEGGRGTAFARRAQVSPDTLWRFAGGAAVSERTSAKLLAALRSDTETEGQRANGSRAPVSHAVDDGSDPRRDPRYWFGYLAAANEIVGHVVEILTTARAMGATANHHLATMLAQHGQWLALVPRADGATGGRPPGLMPDVEAAAREELAREAYAAGLPVPPDLARRFAAESAGRHSTPDVPPAARPRRSG